MMQKDLINNVKKNEQQHMRTQITMQEDSNNNAKSPE